MTVLIQGALFMAAALAYTAWSADGVSERDVRALWFFCGFSFKFPTFLLTSLEKSGTLDREGTIVTHLFFRMADSFSGVVPHFHHPGERLHENKAET